MNNETVLARACVYEIELLLAQSRLRWLGHVSRTEDHRVVKCLYGELTEGSRTVSRPKLRFKDNCKRILKTNDVLGWSDCTKDRVK